MYPLRFSMAMYLCQNIAYLPLHHSHTLQSLSEKNFFFLRIPPKRRKPPPAGVLILSKEFISPPPCMHGHHHFCFPKQTLKNCQSRKTQKVLFFTTIIPHHFDKNAQSLISTKESKLFQVFAG